MPGEGGPPKKKYGTWNKKKPWFKRDKKLGKFMREGIKIGGDYEKTLNMLNEKEKQKKRAKAR